MKKFPTDFAADAAHDLLYAALGQLYDLSPDARVIECQLCGGVDGHTDDCPIPAVKTWMETP